jgi:plastocyanin
MTNVTITNISAWSIGHQACIRVSAGTTVTWEGNFSAHPLQGGVSPDLDPTSPITLLGSDSGSNPANVDFPDAGAYPYYCATHASTMLGVVYVQ